MSRCESFPPLFAPDARVLVVGSMPGEASLRAAQYYAHPQNAFWRILYALWDAEPPAQYAARVAFLRAHGIALWDVARACDRVGSLDSGMRAVETNDFSALLGAAPGIAQVFCNGGTAHALFVRRVAPAFPGLAVTRLPSTSPALTRPFAHKLAAWQAVRAALAAGESARQTNRPDDLNEAKEEMR